MANTHTLVELKVTLRDIEPPIWRVIEVPGAWPLDEVHHAIQAAMGWNNSHLHQFVKGKARYGMMDADGAADMGLEDEREYTLEEIVKVGDTLVYEYDFGDGWEHAIEVTKVTSVAKAPSPRCTAGARACPPEDCGGPHGYARLLEVLANPKHPEYADAKDWAGELHPERFALPKNGLDLRKGMEKVRPRRDPGAGSRDADIGDGRDDVFGNLPRPLVEAVIALDPMQRASLAALIAGSLAEEVGELRTIIRKLAPSVPGLLSPARHGRSKRTHRR